MIIKIELYSFYSIFIFLVIYLIIIKLFLNNKKTLKINKKS